MSVIVVDLNRSKREGKAEIAVVWSRNAIVWRGGSGDSRLNVQRDRTYIDDFCGFRLCIQRGNQVNLVTGSPPSPSASTKLNCDCWRLWEWSCWLLGLACYLQGDITRLILIMSVMVLYDECSVSHGRQYFLLGSRGQWSCTRFSSLWFLFCRDYFWLGK